MVAERSAWSEQLAQVKRMQQWGLEVEPILEGSWVQGGAKVSNAKVGRRLDAWHKQMSRHLTDGTLSEVEQECLITFLQQRSNLRPHLGQGYNREGFPRTNNEMERRIGGLKMGSRRISGRKHWNASLLRSGRSVAYSAWWAQDATRQQQLVEQASRLDRARWPEFCREPTVAQGEQLRRFRFRHKREAFLVSLEERWAPAAST
jgi:hypothetical protein